ncbi:recombinase family protein [Actinomadura viridis]|uniref:DNA invertase Pin-like site-specific DNA recombinase n=1 Tax=Actinomadura viridis TaxID=58110 RepID=A0A931DCT7_9ACTN|nr:recombinase family protein [Actinomadura viridis]MBG6086499.1 DNA invertase Pin-like site-specific DNA recombinase [Actinomadura viridis]
MILDTLPRGTSASLPVGAYVRLSEDKALKAGAAAWRREGDQVVDQLEKINAFVAPLGWYVAKVYNDNNTPASDPLIVRGDFEEMLVDLEMGVTIQGIVFYHSDRLARLEYDAARINRLYTINTNLVGKAVTGGTDLSTPEGRSLFMMQATMGGMEIHRNKARISSTNRRLAEQGVMHGGPRPFGWEEDRSSLHPVESEDLAAAIRAVPSGKKVGSIRNEWFGKGYKKRQTKKGREKHGERDMPLDHSTVEAILVNPRNCGYMAHLPQSERRAGARPWMPDHVVYKNGKPVRGPWEPVVTPEEWAACVETLEDRKKKRKKGLNKPHETSEKYLLAGIARCGKCMFPLTANWYSKNSTSYERYGYRYACLSSLGGCGGVTRVGPPIEDLVESAFLDEVRRSLDAAVNDDDVDETVHNKRLAEIEHEIEEVNQRRKSKRITIAQALDVIEDLEKERAELRSEHRRLMASKLQRKTEYPTLLKHWDGYSIAEKKHRLKRDIRAVIVQAQGRGRLPFKPELIEIEWIT